jgi:small-conductance mechanosensitive channel
LMMIKKAFDENDIKLAVPTVQVSGEDPQAAAAHQMRQKKKAEAAAAAAGGAS